MSMKLLAVSRLRGLALVLFGFCIGAALVGPVSAGGPAPRGTTQSRFASCAGLDFYPLHQDVLYGSAGTLRIANGYVLCDPALPHRAVVTRVQFTMLDNSGTEGLNHCALVRTGLQRPHATTAQVMASVPDTLGAPGLVRFASSSPSFPTVDNARFGYFLQCQITAKTTDVGLYGANVTYTISSTNG